MTLGITIRFVEQTVARLQSPMTSFLVRGFTVQKAVDRIHSVRRGELLQHGDRETRTAQTECPPGCPAVGKIDEIGAAHSGCL